MKHFLSKRNLVQRSTAVAIAQDASDAKREVTRAFILLLLIVHIDQNQVI